MGSKWPESMHCAWPMTGNNPRDGGGGMTYGGAPANEELRAGQQVYEGEPRSAPKTTKGARSHPIDGLPMRRRKRDGAPVFVDDDGLTMANDKFGDTCNLRRKKGTGEGRAKLEEDPHRDGAHRGGMTAAASR
jgi:hypothetical protein